VRPDNKVLSGFGERITRAREKYTDLSEAKLAERIGIADASKFNRWVNKQKGEPSVDFIYYVRLANVMKCSVLELTAPEFHNEVEQMLARELNTRKSETTTDMLINAMMNALLEQTKLIKEIRDEMRRIG